MPGRGRRQAAWCICMGRLRRSSRAALQDWISQRGHRLPTTTKIAAVHAPPEQDGTEVRRHFRYHRPALAGQLPPRTFLPLHIAPAVLLDLPYSFQIGAANARATGGIQSQVHTAAGLVVEAQVYSFGRCDP